MIVFDTGVKWADSLDSTPSTAQAHSVASGRAFSCAILGSALLHRLSPCFGVHQHHCGFSGWYVSSKTCSSSSLSGCTLQPWDVVTHMFRMQVVGPSMQLGSMGLCVWRRS